MRRGRFHFALVAGVVLAAMLTSIASADAGCGLFRSFAFTMQAPDAFTAPGVHAFQWREEFIDDTGTPVVEFADNQIETVAGAPTYAGSVLLRLRSNWGWEGGGSINTGVEQIAPGQDIRFYAAVFCEKGHPTCGQNRLFVRWQDDGGWTPWTAVPGETDNSVCAQFRLGMFERSYGSE